MSCKYLIIITLVLPIPATADDHEEPVPAVIESLELPAAAASTPPATLSFPCESDVAFRGFDFWVGSWDVHLADGSLAGHNDITREQRSCVLIENWRSASGGTGTSINYVDKITGEWVQVWNDANGSQINIRGGMSDEGMLLTGTIHYVATGQTLPFRGLWTPLEDGRVRQYFEQSTDKGKTWSPWFEGFYSHSEATD